MPYKSPGQPLEFNSKIMDQLGALEEHINYVVHIFFMSFYYFPK